MGDWPSAEPVQPSCPCDETARLRDLVLQVREDLLSAPDTLCLERARLITQAYQLHASEPAPVLHARAFAHLLDHMMLDLASNPVFAGNTSSRPRAWALYPEFGIAHDGQVLIENEGLEGILDEVPDDLRAFWSERAVGGNSGIGHLAVDYEHVVRTGLLDVVREVESCDDGSDTPENAYRRGMIIALRAVLRWARRYVDAAERAAASEPDPFLRGLYARIATACRRVPAQPARDLFEGLQAIALVHLAIALEGHGMSISIGLPDRVLEPFLGPGFDEEEATALIAAFMLKITANSFLGRGYLSQAITLGGADATGRDRCNALTRCFLKACDLLRVGDPPVFVRWHEHLDPGVKTQALDMLAHGVSMPLLVHDRPTIQGLIAAGVSPEDAADYCIIGCNELGIPGRLMETAATRAGTVLYVDVLRDVLLDLPDPAAIRGIGELLAAMERKLTERGVEMRRRAETHWQRMAEQVPTPFTSALMRGCARQGKDLLVGMAYRTRGAFERGLTNAVNALAAIDHLVFRERSATLGEIVQALRDDFADEGLRRRIWAAPKWGNDDERADRFAAELLALRERALEAADQACGHRGHTVCHVVRSLHHLDGRCLGATPDGRRAGEPLGDSVGAALGTARAGPTAVLRSVARIDSARHYRGGYNLNLTLPKSQVSPATLEGLIEGFFSQGGQELQIGVLDADELRRAQRQPERYGDLVVRVAGLSARFVDLAREEQDEIIARAEAVQP